MKKEYFPSAEKEYKCTRCTSSFNTYESLRKHVARMHKISSENFYVEYKLNGIKPLCKCGCGEETNWNRYNEVYDYMI